MTDSRVERHGRDTVYWEGHCIGRDTVIGRDTALGGTLYWLGRTLYWEGHCIGMYIVLFGWDTVLGGTLYCKGHCIV